jgi:hypothetical protein
LDKDQCKLRRYVEDISVDDEGKDEDPPSELPPKTVLCPRGKLFTQFGASEAREIAKKAAN